MSNSLYLERAGVVKEEKQNALQIPSECGTYIEKCEINTFILLEERENNCGKIKLWLFEKHIHIIN